MSGKSCGKLYFFHTVIHNLWKTQKTGESILHADGEKHEEISSLFLAILGLNVDAGQGRGEGDAYRIGAAGAQAVDEVTVVEGDDQIITLVVDRQLVVSRAGAGGGGDRVPGAIALLHPRGYVHPAHHRLAQRVAQREFAGLLDFHSIPLSG